MPCSKGNYIFSPYAPLNSVLTYAFHQLSFLYPSSFKSKPPKLLASNQGYGSLSPVPFALAKSWSFKCSVPWSSGKDNTSLNLSTHYCLLIIYVSMVSSSPSQGLRPYCSGNSTNKKRIDNCSPEKLRQATVGQIFVGMDV